ncbi:hypothetical protein GUJ93_ZPchr0012g19237 [Zizania palustris]|uniref:Uncharacterized protein n=1 Tax=Zizania palustris TaxID=103762 RepID=A0A8J5WS07_ZIZPA|nr:hypothetical protein GUJ93_ZPchr0012g19237 [Zizania palustris]
MERIIAMSVVGAGPGNVFGPAMSAGALESFGGRQSGGGANKRPAEARGGGAGAGAGPGPGRDGRPAEERPAAGGRTSAAAAAKGSDAGALFDPPAAASDRLALHCFEAISPY